MARTKIKCVNVMIKSLSFVILGGSLALSAWAAPTIPVPPASMSKCVGQSATFSVTATGNGTLTYQWKFGAFNIPGETNDTYTIPSVQATHAGAYTVLVTDLDGSTLSAPPAFLPVMPVPTASVNSAAICPGGSATLTATTGASYPTYLWSPGGETTPSITVSPAVSTTYTVTVTDGNTGCSASASGQVSITPPPTVSVNSAAICVWGSATLTATTGASSPTYLWSPGGATTPEITVSPAVSTTYTVTVTDGVTGCSAFASGQVGVSGVMANWALAGVASASSVYQGTALASRANDGNRDGNYGNNSVFHSGTTAQDWWRVDLGAPRPIKRIVLTLRTDCCGERNTNLAVRVYQGATTATTLLFATTNKTGTSFTTPLTIDLPVTVEGQLVEVQTLLANYLGLAEVQVFSAIFAPADLATLTVTPPANVSVPEFSVGILGPVSGALVPNCGPTPVFNYQWQRDGVDLAGAIYPTYTFTASPTNNSSLYRCILSVPGLSGTSAVATVTATPVAPWIITQPANLAVPTMSGPSAFTVAASGTAPLGYQWYSNGVALAGATATSYSVSNLPFGSAGSFTVVVSNLVGSITSAVAMLTVTPISGITFDFNTPGQYINTPFWMDTADWVNSVLPAVPYESTFGGITNGGALDMTAGGTENTSVLMPLSYDFSLSGKTLFASMMVKVKAPSSNNRLLQFGFQTLNVKTQVNRGVQSSLTGIDGNGVMTVRLNSTAQPALTYQMEQQTKVIAGTGTTQTANPTTMTLTPGNWYLFSIAFTNIKATVANTYSVVGVLQDMGVDGATPGAIVSSMGPSNVVNADLVAAKNLYLAWRSFENCGADYFDNVVAYTTNGPIFFVQPPVSQTVLQGRTATFQALVDGAGPYAYQWYKNGSPIAGAGSWKYITPPVTLADNGAQYTVTVTGPGSTTLNSAAALLTVQPDPLVVLSAGSVDGLTAGVRFNQPVNQFTAENIANYTVSGASVAKAVLRPDGKSVWLTVSPRLTGTFTVTVQDVLDLSGGTVGTPNAASGTVMNLISLDVNAPAQPGETYSAQDGGFELVGNGADIWGTADQYRYVYGQRTGDFDVRMQVPWQTVTRSPSKGAIVLRELLDPPSRMLFLEVNPVYPGRCYFSTGKRDTYGASANSWNLSTPGASYTNAWMRFRRVGNTFTAYSSTNGLDWLLFGQTTAVYPPTVYLGVGACAVANASGTFQKVVIQNYGDFVGYPAATVALLSDPTNVTVNAGSTATFYVSAAATGITNSQIAFQWQRSDGAGGWTNVSTANGYPNLAINALFASNSFVTPPLYTITDNGAQFRCVAKLPGGATATGSPVTVTVVDSAVPTITSATVPLLDSFQVVLVYSEPVNTTAIVPGNYLITNAAGADMGVAGVAVFAGDPRTVVLTTVSPLALGNYAVVVNNVQDLAGNTIAPNSVRAFTQAGTTPTQPVVIEFYMRTADGAALTDLNAATNLARVANRRPDSMVYNNVFGFNTGLGDSGINYYYAKGYTYFVPPTNGLYKFWIRADDAVQLFMNTNAVNSTDPAGMVFLCEAPYVNGNYRTNSSMRVGGIALTAGQKYYLEARWKEGGGGDGFSIAVRANADTGTPGTGEVIPASMLAYPSSAAPATPVLVDLFESLSTATPTRAYFATLTNDSRWVLNTPTSLSWAGYNSIFGYNITLADSVRNGYGARLRSYFVAPSNGLYRFFIRSDDCSELYMNTNAVNSTDPNGAVLLAWMDGWNGAYNSTPTATAQNVSLTGGQRYYIELRYLEGGGGDGGSLAVRAQDDATVPTGGTGTGDNIEVAQANLFEYPAALDVRAGAIRFATLTPVSPTVPDGQTVTFTASGIAGAQTGLGYIWLKNGVPVPAPNSATYTTPPLLAGDNGAVYSVIVTNNFSSATASRTVTVAVDTTPPVLLSVAGSPLYNRVTLVFNEPLDSVTATYPFTYIIPGLSVLGAVLDSTRTKVSLYTTMQTPGQNYLLTVSGLRDLSLTGNSLTTNTQFTAWIAGGGGVYVEVFTNITTGTAVANLTGAAKFVQNLPDLVGYVPTFGFGTYTPGFNDFTGFTGNPGLDNFGVRMSALFLAPSNGFYRFYTKSDDASQFFMNTNGPSPVGDLILATSPNSPAGQEAPFAIDGNVNTKYLNFDKFNTGFTIALQAGPTVVTGLRLTTAGDAVERDPMTFTIEGTTGSAVAGPWTLVASGATGLDPITARLTVGPTLTFANSTAYSAYRILFPTIRWPIIANSMQIAEVELLDANGLKVTSPGKVMIAQETGCCHAYGDISVSATVSPDIYLTGGRAYYMEALMKEGGGGDYMHVAFRAVDTSSGTPIGGVPMGAAGAVAPAAVEVIGQQFLLPAGDPTAFGGFVVGQAPPQDLYVYENDLVTLSASVNVLPAYLRPATLSQWQKLENGVWVNLSGIVGQTISVRVPLADDGVAYRLHVSTPGAETNLTTVIHVTPDVTPPYIVSAGSADGTNIVVQFSERISPQFANEGLNWSVNLGANNILALAQRTNSVLGVVTPLLDQILLTLENPVSGAFTVEALQMHDFAVADNVGDSAVEAVVAGLADEDVGTPGTDPLFPGHSYMFSSNALDMVAGGSDIWNNADGMHYLYRPVFGNFDLKTRVSSLAPANTWSKAGLMARVAATGNSRHIDLLVTPPAALGGTDTYTFQSRDTDGGASYSYYNNMGTGVFTNRPSDLGTNVWLRFKREGNVFTGFISSNGLDWTFFTNRVTPDSGAAVFPTTVLVGLAVTSHDNTATNRMTLAEFRDLYFPPAPAIITHPVGADLVIHQAHTFTVAAVSALDAGPVTYQWWKDGRPLPGATTATLVLTNLAAADAGTYTASVGNDGGGTLSAPAVLTVLNLPPVTPPKLFLEDLCDFTAPAARVLAGDTDPEGDPLTLLGVSGLAPVTFTANFDDGLVPPGATLYGSASVVGTGGVNDTGNLHLTEAAASLFGAFLLNDLVPGRAISAFTARFKIRIGDGSANPADGFSFNLATDLVQDAGVTAEEGVGSGLSVCLDNYDSGGGEAPAIDVKYAGVQIGHVMVPKINSPRWIDLALDLKANGALTLRYDGTNVFTDLATGFVPKPNARFGLYARTGGEYEAHWLDDLTITVLTADTALGNFVSLDLPNGTVSYVYSNTCGIDTFYYLVSDGQINGTTLGEVTIHHPPLARNDQMTATSGRASSMPLAKLRANDYNPDGVELTFTYAQPPNGTVVVTPSAATYTSTPGFVGKDAWTYTLDDGRGNRSTASVSVTVKAGTTTMATVMNSAIKNGKFWAKFFWAPNTTYTVQTTTDVAAGPWLPLTTVRSDANGVIEFTDTVHNPAEGQRYYRIVP